GVLPGQNLTFPNGSAVPVANAYLDTITCNSLIVTSEVFYDEWLYAADAAADSEDDAEIPSRRRDAAILQATRVIDSINWKGSRYFPRQALQFPRIPEGYQFPVGTYSQTGPDLHLAN